MKKAKTTSYCDFEHRPARERIKYSVKNYWFIYLLILPGLLALLIYAYGPMLMQVYLSFVDYNLGQGFSSKFVWFDNFRYLFKELPNFKRLVSNTVWISLLSFVFGFFPPLILAIMMFDISSNRFRKAAQTIVYIPYFFSWVIVYTICYGMFSNTGIVNGLLQTLGRSRVEFLMDSEWVWPLLILSGVWKNVGWGTIIYFAAMQSIDVNLYDAAKLDGCGPIRRTFAVTLPGIRNITFFLFVLALGGLLSGGNTEQIILFGNNSNISKSETIGTWLFYISQNDVTSFSTGAAFSFLQSGIGMLLVLIGNKVSTKYAHVGIW